MQKKAASGELAALRLLGKPQFLFGTTYPETMVPETGPFDP